MTDLFIKPQYLEILMQILNEYCPNAEVWAYGSRVNGQAHEGSDLDLVIKDFHSSSASLFELKELLENSSIPFLVDIHEYKHLPESFQNEINKNYVIIK